MWTRAFQPDIPQNMGAILHHQAGGISRRAFGRRSIRKAPFDICSAMTKDQVKEVLDRVLTWPPERQEDAAQSLLVLEAPEGELYRPSDDELAAIEEGLAQARRGEFVSAEEIAALLRPGDR
jgi:predicted transcriptional regulator